LAELHPEKNGKIVFPFKAGVFLCDIIVSYYIMISSKYRVGANAFVDRGLGYIRPHDPHVFLLTFLRCWKSDKAALPENMSCTGLLSGWASDQIFIGGGAVLVT
jgi:hypothetical protein